MKLNKKLWCFAVLSLIMFPSMMHGQDVPHLKRNGTIEQLIVDGKPFLILGGELHNSSSSNLEYLKPTWGKLKEMNLNTVLTALSWQLIEPKEGQFDFALVDGLLKDAREHDLKLIFLWFGSWKNGLSHYAPLWVKEDQKRFPRVRLNDGKATETLTPLSTEAQKCRCKSFCCINGSLEESRFERQDRNYDAGTK
jgi:beta-galactosidase GanA